MIRLNLLYNYSSENLCPLLHLYFPGSFGIALPSQPQTGQITFLGDTVTFIIE